ncbi:hypothetical protein Vretifemale_16623 [Volvox reticuliferus]|uniref:Uncharacterized protein n=1 Tax=Volvox reticuliferus TaxID=1737510 RepID=A0A8J4CTY9_9CHLO|nr:hypothetical protein Vretifemale_16623 [Volvox reticuliferus]
MSSPSPAASVADGKASLSMQMHQAAVQGNTALLSQLLAQHPTQVDGSTNSGTQAPLLVAALLGQQNVVEMLLSAGGNPNRRGKRQETALMLAAQRGHVDVMRVLLTRGAQATAVDQRGWTALHFGAFAGHAASIRALLSGTAPTGRAALLELRTGKGETALALAAFGRKDDCCRVLIEAGAKPSLINDSGDKEYVQKLQQSGEALANGSGSDGATAPVTPKGLSTISPKASRGGARGAAAGSGLAARRAVGRTPLMTDLGNGQSLDSPAASPSARPAMQFSGTPSEFERLITPQQSDITSSPKHHHRRLASPGRMANGYRNGQYDSDGGPRSPKQPDWSLHEFDYRGTPMLNHRPTGLLFTSVPEDSFPNLVGIIIDGKPRWLGEADLPLLESMPQVCEALAATVPVGRLLVRRLHVVPEPVLRLCVLLGLHEISELRELILLEPDSVRHEAAWAPAGLSVNHSTQLLPLLRSELLRPSNPHHATAPFSEDGSWPMVDPDAPPARVAPAAAAVATVVSPDDDSVAAAGPLPTELIGLPLVQHLLQRYGLSKLMVQVAELEITAAPDLLVLAHPDSLQGAGAPLSKWEEGRLARMLRDLPGLLKSHSKARDRAETEAALGPAIEALMRQRRLDVLARPSRGALVTYDDLEGGGGGGRLKGPVRVAVVLQEDGSGSNSPKYGIENGAANKFIVRDVESDRILHMLVGHIRRVRPADAAKHVRGDYAPPSSAGVPVTPLSAAPGLLVTRGSSWGRGDAYDVYGEGIVGELLRPDEQADEDGVDGAGNGEANTTASGEEGEEGPKLSSRWLVRWPDGQVYSYAVGAGGSFELSFLGLHWRSGAPVLDSHRGLLVAPGELAAIPVSRGPTWALDTDDGLPGSPGAALLDRTTSALEVDWLRDLHNPRSYYPDPANGAYPVVHAMMAGQPVTLFTARQGARVEPAGLHPQAMSGSGTHFYHKYYQSWRASTQETVAPGILLAPLRLEKDGLVVVWLVSWPHAGRQEARVGPTAGYCDLVFAPLADAPQAKNRLPHEHWHHQSAEGRLVRLNPAQLSLQPSVTAGPLRPAGRDVGVVVRDLGPGVHCGLLVRQLAGASAYWYDEDVLLPLTPVEIRRLPSAMASALAVGNAAVPVMDCTAMPGMLVRRCYDDGSTLKCSTKEQQVGILMAPVSSGRWLVRWSDGSSAVYNTGAGSKFQLSYVFEHPQAGSPLAMPRSLDPAVLSEAAVVPGFDCCIPFAPAGAECDLALVGGASLQVDDEDKPRLLVQERMPVTVGAEAKQFRFSAGGLFRLYELAHAAVPGQPVTVFTAKQGLRVVLHPTDPTGMEDPAAVAAAVAAGGGAQPMGTLARPIRLGAKGVTKSNTPGSPMSPSRRVRGVSRVRKYDSAYASYTRSVNGDAGSDGAEAPPEVDPTTAVWEVAWDNGTVSPYVLGVSPAVTALRVAPQPGFKVPPAAAPRDPPDRRLRIHDPVLHLPLKGLQVLDDHIYSLASNLDTAVCAINATIQRLVSLWIGAASCEPIAPYRAIVHRVPMHGDTVLLAVGPTAKKDGSVGYLDPEEAQDLARACRAEDTELAAATVALQTALRGAPHLDLDAQRAAEKAALERKWRMEAETHERSLTEEGIGAGVDSTTAQPVNNFQGRWILTGISYEDAIADAAVGIAVAVPAAASGGRRSSDGGEADSAVPQLVATGPCSAFVTKALERFNAALKAAQGALDGACSGYKYQMTVLSRPAGAAIPLGHLQLTQRKASETDPLLVQEMLETFHSFTIGLAAMPPAGLGAAGDGDATPLGPLAIAALNLAPELRSAAVRAHTAMNEYTAAQAAEWRRQIRVMYEEGAAAAAAAARGGTAGAGLVDDDGDADSDVATSEVISNVGLGVATETDDGTRRGQYNGLALTTASPPLVKVHGGVSVGDQEGLVQASEHATCLTPSEVAARFNDALLQLWRAAGKANGCGGSADVSDAVVKVYTYMHEQVSKAVAAYGITFMGQDAENQRKEAAAAAQEAVAAVTELQALAKQWNPDEAALGAAEGSEAEGAAAAVADKIKEGVAQVRRLVQKAVSLVTDVSVCANEAADAADELGRKGLTATTEELLQDTGAAAAVTAAARWAAAATDGAAMAAHAAGDAALAVVELATRLAEDGGPNMRPAVEVAIASAASLAALVRGTAAAARQQKESALSLLQERVDAAGTLSQALGARASDLERRVSEQALALAAGSGSDQLLAKLKAELEIANDCATKAGAFLAEAEAVSKAAFEESDHLERELEEASEKATEASSSAAEVQVEAVRLLVAAAADAFREPQTAMALLGQAWTALEFASKINSSSVPSSAYESIAVQAAELCRTLAGNVERAATELAECPKDPDRLSPKQRNLSSAAAMTRAAQSLALRRPGMGLPATAAASLALAARQAAQACSEVVGYAQALRNEAVSKAKVSVLTREGGDMASRLQYEIMEMGQALEDLVMVATGSPEAPRAQVAVSDVARLLDEADSDLVKVDKYSREHTTWRQVAVAIAVQNLSVGFRRLPQALDAATAALDKALTAAAAAAAPSEAPDGGDADGTPLPTPGTGGSSGEDVGRARAGFERAFHAVAEAERELRRATMVGRMLVGRSWGVPSGMPGGAEVRDAEEARAKWITSAASAMSATAQGLISVMRSKAVQSASHLMRLNGAVMAVEEALRLLGEGLGLPRTSEVAAVVAEQLRAAQEQRQAALEEAAETFGGVAAATRAHSDPVGAILAAATPVDGDGGNGGGRARSGGGGAAEVVFRPVFVQTAPTPSQHHGQSTIHFHVAVLLKEPGRRAAPSPPEVDAVLTRPAIRHLMEPLEHLIDVTSKYP